MERIFTLEYWQDEGWFVGRLTEVPEVFSQGESLTELENNICEAYKSMMETETLPNLSVQPMEKEVHGRRAPVPRHTEIKYTLCELIKKQLGV